MPILMLKSSKLLFLLRTAAQNILSPISHGKHSITYLCLPQTRIVDLTSPSWTSDKLSLDLLIFVSQTCFLSFESSKVFVFASFLTAARRNNTLLIFFMFITAFIWHRKLPLCRYNAKLKTLVSDCAMQCGEY